jgi:8-amino-7-oxononanoate synthase
MDAGVYAISRWGVQRAAMLGATVRTFPHHNAAALERALVATPRGRTPIIVTDGVCPTCGRVAPLSSYMTMARKRSGLLVIDDTQALGVLGHSPNPQLPYGRGGGGSLRWCGIDGTEVLVLASLAKGLGVPVAVLAGSRARVRAFEAKSLTRIHCSPPSIAVLHAAERAVVCNRRVGDLRRARLAALVRRFQRGLGTAHHSLVGTGIFPVQSIRPPSGMTAAELHDRLLESGLRTVLRRGEDGTPCVSLLLSARHTADAIDFAAAAVRDASAARSPTTTFTRKEPHHEEPVCH